MGDTVLKLRAISKKYSQVVLDQVSFDIQKGESIALVGANGAGKSTLIKMILGLVQPTSGEGFLWDSPLWDAKARQRVGYLPEMPGYWGEVSAQEFLKLMAFIRKVPADLFAKRRENLLSALGLRLRGGRRMAGYSKGMLQRAGVAQLLIHDPDFLILDEPMSGLDPRAQEKLRLILEKLKDRGKTFLISSHSLPDIRSLCTRVIVLEKSKVVEDGPTEMVLEKLVSKYRSSEPWDEDPLGEISDVLE